MAIQPTDFQTRVKCLNHSVAISLLYSIVAVAGLFGARELQAAPQTIILIRHADKNMPLDGSDNLNSRDLARDMNLDRVIPQCFG